MGQLLDTLQWPAMAVTVLASWLVASARPSRRNTAFWLYLLSNLLWTVWGIQAQAWALIVLQVCLASINIRGARKTSND